MIDSIQSLLTYHPRYYLNADIHPKEWERSPSIHPFRPIKQKMDNRISVGNDRILRDCVPFWKSDLLQNQRFLTIQVVSSIEKNSIDC